MNPVMLPIIDFVSPNIASADWKKRYSALIALGAITEGPDKVTFMNIIIPGIQNLINMFNDSNAKVREAIAWVVSRICEHHSDVIQHSQILPGLIPVIINALKDKPRVSNHICRAIENLAVSLAPKDDN